MNQSEVLGEYPGSSPRVRGKHGAVVVVLDAQRLIPARAGKTAPAWRAHLRRWAHPRACGENTAACWRCQPSDGSSPRVRGKPEREHVLRARPRLIPARAGKTNLARGKAGARRAHPRACGENGDAPYSMSQYQGSSPRVRGKLATAVREALAARLIPARAGKTSSSSGPTSGTWAHPRACGENPGESRRLGPGVGSSPRVRGKQRAGDAGARLHGLIPARAGKTGAPFTIPPRCQAHPRACGENVHRVEEHR